MNETILVVDDEPKILQLAKDYLVDNGFKVLTSGDGVQAMAIARQEKPDLIVLDIALPKVDGWQILESVRSNPETAGVPIIVITAHGQGSAAERALHGGADRFFEKPFWPPELSAAVDTLLGPIAEVS